MTATAQRGTILVTGGAGYIGSHCCVELLNAGYTAVVIDNLCNSKVEAIRRVEQICAKEVAFYQADVCDTAALAHIFNAHVIDAAIHFAALKAVGESVARPLDYYRNNLNGLLALLSALREYGAKRLVFSSSATVYGNPHTVPIHETFPLSVTNPYGQTKLISEQMLQDLLVAEPDWRIATLRYFNPVGAHASGLIGEDPNGVPNNLMPYLAQVAIGKRDRLRVFGGDYPTADGTGVRDYIHVVDLARGHLAALDLLSAAPSLASHPLNGDSGDRNGDSGNFTVNLGTGCGYSVLEMIHAFEAASGRSVPYEIVARRPGDIAACYADPSLAEKVLGWRAQYGIEQMCADQWRWQSMNPDGYR